MKERNVVSIYGFQKGQLETEARCFRVDAGSSDVIGGQFDIVVEKSTDDSLFAHLNR